MIDLDLEHLAIVKQILAQHIPDVTVKAFGSRVKGTAKEFSDLDLVLIAEQDIPATVMNDLRFAFSDSNLPIMVDLVDWHGVSESFRELITKDAVKI